MAHRRNTVFHRAWRDTTSWLFTSPIAWIFAAIIQLVCAILATHFISVNANLGDKAIYGTISVSAGLILFLVLTYLIQLIVVPYRQRNELRRELLNIKTNKSTSDNESIPQKLEKISVAMVSIDQFFKKVDQWFEQQANTIRGIDQVSVIPLKTLELLVEKALNPSNSIRMDEVIEMPLGKELKNTEQPNASRRMDKPIGITETRSGKPAFIYPIDDAQTLGNIPMGSPQTFTGLNIDESPIFINIPKFGYVVIMITFISNDKVEVNFMADIKKTALSNQTAKVTLFIDSEEVSLFIPAGPSRFFPPQVSEVTIAKWHGAASIRIETGI